MSALFGLCLIPAFIAGCSESDDSAPPSGTSESPRTSAASIMAKVPHAYKVTEILTGDSFTIDADGKEEKISLIGIRAPKIENPKECFSSEAQQALSDLIKDKEIQFYTEPEKKIGEEDDSSRYISTDAAKDVGLVLLRDGYAQIQDDADFDRKQEYQQVVEEAKSEQKGLWAAETCNGQVAPR